VITALGTGFGTLLEEELIADIDYNLACAFQRRMRASCSAAMHAF